MLNQATLVAGQFPGPWTHRRGHYATVGMGVSFGGGQKASAPSPLCFRSDVDFCCQEPQSLVNHAAVDRAMLSFVHHPDVGRVVGFITSQSHLYAS